MLYRLGSFLHEKPLDTGLRRYDDKRYISDIFRPSHPAPRRPNQKQEKSIAMIDIKTRPSGTNVNHHRPQR